MKTISFITTFIFLILTAMYGDVGAFGAFLLCFPIIWLLVHYFASPILGLIPFIKPYRTEQLRRRKKSHEEIIERNKRTETNWSFGGFIIF